MVCPFSFSVCGGLSEPPHADLNLCLATREDDPHWASFVCWVVEGTFFAECYKTTEFSFNNMPLVGLFGPSFERMFWDSICAVGNCGSICSRNVEPFIPRTGLNLLYDVDKLVTIELSTAWFASMPDLFF